VIPRLTRLAAFAVAAAITQPVHAKGNDELWEMTTKMEMEGMPMGMPAQTREVCMEAGKTEAAVPKGDSDCRTTNVKHSGSKTTFRMECTGREKMTGEGEITRTKDRMSGTIHLKGAEMDMKQSFSGRRIGSCDAKTHRQAQMEQAQKPIEEARTKGCSDSVEALEPSAFRPLPNEAEMSPEQRAAMRKVVGCDDYRKKFIAKAEGVAKSMRNPKGYLAAYDRYRHLDDALRFSGLDPKKIQTAACKSGVSQRDWDFVSRHCPVEAKQVADKNCIGRDYTEVMQNTTEEFRGLCSRHATQRNQAAVVEPPADTATCKARLRDRDWRFVGARCPDEAKSVAAERCVGRDYTEVMVNVAEEFRTICARYAPQRGHAAAPGSAPEQKKSEESTTGKAIKEGTNVLRKFLNF
jgi:hypothetical protein